MGNPDPLHAPFLSAGLAILVAALLNLDRRAFAQTGLNRPLVAGVIVGFATGDPRTGLALGIWTELLWLWRLTVGGELTPNGCAALSSVLIALNLARVLAPDLSRGLPLSPLAFFLVPVIAHLAVLPETRARKYSSRILALLNRKLKAAAESRGLPVTGGASLPRLSPEPDGRPETRP
ncbi:MAG: PTS sugar transporter subunit IIC, partial [Deltaproteobacteria bacterium]|nr:PTS sugar transporter subunit IIC [Deltaproteobacteria bacterium]